MSVLVAVASKHGATREIAEAIGETLARRDVAATVADVGDVDTLDPYTAVVVGGAVYMGRWPEAARSFVERHAEELGQRPTWLFSSGPIGSPPKPDPSSAVDLGSITSTIGAREHRVFAGRLDKSRLGLVERTVTAAVHAPEGDFRDWDEIHAWAESIADDLASREAGANA